MNARDIAQETAAMLAAAGIPEARFEAELLVRHVTGLSRAQFFASPAIADAGPIAEAIQRRLQREPAAYITGVREFYGIEFGVGPGVLVPRPETELLVELALSEAKLIPAPVLVDVGTGSGCVAIAAASNLERRITQVIATDISPAALRVAARNRAVLNSPVHLVLGHLASMVARADIIVANLPYIPSGEIDALEPEVSRWEPRVALDGGPDGFILIRELIGDCANRLRPRLLALEVAFGQAPAVAAQAAAAGAMVTVVPDLAGIDRVVCARWE